MRNHTRLFRPLRGGIQIFNPGVNEPGTLGFLAAGEGGGRWIVGCHHVLCGPEEREPVYQPIDAPENLVAFTDPARSLPQLDVAAARVVDGIACLPEMLGIGPLGIPVAPEPGMRVIKSGAATGITEGTITDVRPGRVEIEPYGLPEDYQLSDAGDSGALWVLRATAAPVVLHQGGSAGPRAFAYGIAAVDALDALRLAILPLAAAAG